MQTKPGLNSIGTTLKKELEKRFQSYIDPEHLDFKTIYVVSTSLDLRYRFLLNDKQLKVASNYLQRKLIDEDEVQVTDDIEEEDTQHTNTPDESDEPPFKRFRLLNQFVAEKETQECQDMVENDEILQYFSLKKKVSNETEFDPLMFWQNNQQNFPTLAPIAQDILTIPATSTPVERTFSVAGYCTSGRRNRLSGMNLEMEVLLKKNKAYI
jgi:hypothetical protein